MSMPGEMWNPASFAILLLTISKRSPSRSAQFASLSGNQIPSAFLRELLQVLSADRPPQLGREFCASTREILYPMKGRNNFFNRFCTGHRWLCKAYGEIAEDAWKEKTESQSRESRSAGKKVVVDMDESNLSSSGLDAHLLQSDRRDCRHSFMFSLRQPKTLTLGVLHSNEWHPAFLLKSSWESHPRLFRWGPIPL